MTAIAWFVLDKCSCRNNFKAVLFEKTSIYSKMGRTKVSELYWTGKKEMFQWNLSTKFLWQKSNGKENFIKSKNVKKSNVKKKQFQSHRTIARQAAKSSETSVEMGSRWKCEAIGMSSFEVLIVFNFSCGLHNRDIFLQKPNARLFYEKCVRDNPELAKFETEAIRSKMKNFRSSYTKRGANHYTIIA